VVRAIPALIPDQAATIAIDETTSTVFLHAGSLEDSDGLAGTPLSFIWPGHGSIQPNAT
jgi:hypothetical protein